MKLIGLRHDIVAKDDIYYLIFYDIDGHILTDQLIQQVDFTMQAYGVSYMIIRTKNGHHIIGLTPLDELRWAGIFHKLKHMFHSYYGGIVIRISRKVGEIQYIVKLEESYGEVIPNLFNLYAGGKFPALQKKPWKKEFAKYLLVFENYRSKKD